MELVACDSLLDCLHSLSSFESHATVYRLRVHRLTIASRFFLSTTQAEAKEVTTRMVRVFSKLYKNQKKNWMSRVLNRHHQCCARERCSKMAYKCDRRQTFRNLEFKVRVTRVCVGVGFKYSSYKIQKQMKKLCIKSFSYLLLLLGKRCGLSYPMQSLSLCPRDSPPDSYLWITLNPKEIAYVIPRLEMQTISVKYSFGLVHLLHYDPLSIDVANSLLRKWEKESMFVLMLQ